MEKNREVSVMIDDRRDKSLQEQPSRRKEKDLQSSHLDSPKKNKKKNFTLTGFNYLPSPPKARPPLAHLHAFFHKKKQKKREKKSSIPSQ